MSKKNLIFVIPTLRMGGAEKAMISLLNALDPGKVNVDLFLFEAGGVLQPQVPDWVNILEADGVTRGTTLELRYYFRELLSAGQWCAAASRLWITLRSKISSKPGFSWGVVEKHIPRLEKKYDVAIGYLEGFADFFVLDKVQADQKIGWIHSDFTNRNLPAEENRYYGRFDRLVTISEVCRNAFVKKVPEVESKMIVLENIVLEENVRRKAEEKPADQWERQEVYNLVTVGRLDHHKGIDIAAKAAKLLSARQIPFCWHVYGQGVMRDELQQYVKENDLEGRFILEGLRENPYPYMKQADLIVQPSRLEGKSIVLDEAKILGKAIVVTAYPSVTDQITDRVTGLITRIEPEAIADGIELLLRDPALKARLEANAAREPNGSYKTVVAFYELIDA